MGFHSPSSSSSCQILDPSQVFHNIGNGDVKPISPLIGKMSLPFTAWRLSSHLHEMIYLQKNNNFWQHCGNHHWLMFDGNLVLCMALTNPIHDAQPEWQFTVIEQEKRFVAQHQANILILWPFEMPDSLCSVHAAKCHGSSSFWHYRYCWGLVSIVMLLSAFEVLIFWELTTYTMLTLSVQ